MLQKAGGALAQNETLDEQKDKDLLKMRLESINLDAAKEDVRPFLRDPVQLDLWSVDFFLHWINLLKFV